MYDEFSGMSHRELAEIEKPNTQSTSNTGTGYGDSKANNQGYNGRDSGYNSNRDNYSRDHDGGSRSVSSGGGNNSSYNSGNRNSGSYQGGKSGGSWNGGGNKWNKKEDVAEDPYLPIALYVDKDMPQQIKDQAFNIANRFLAKGYTVRINADDPDFTRRLMQLSSKHVEVYIPWKGFDDIESKHYWNTETSKYVAGKNFLGWDKIPDVVKKFLARNVRMMFGDKNNSLAMCLITWSHDGACRSAEVTRDTGRTSAVIKMASHYGFPVLNLAKPNVDNILDNQFGLEAF